VTRAISGRTTEATQQHYTTVAQDEKTRAIGHVVELAGVRGTRLNWALCDEREGRPSGAGADARPMGLDRLSPEDDRHPTPRTPAARRTVGYVLAGSSGIGLVATTILGALALGERNVVARHCPDRVCDAEGFDAANRGRTFVNVGTLALGLSVANAAAAAILLWPRRSAAAASIVPLPGGAGLAYGRAF
jgi:hypothetical protein